MPVGQRVLARLREALRVFFAVRAGSIERGLRARAREIAVAGCIAVVMLLSGCGSTPSKPEGAADGASAPQRSESAAYTAPAGEASASADASGGVATAPAPVEVPARAAADFNRAVSLMRAGNTSEAELEFKQLAAGYPQLAGPQINLALIQRKANRLDEAEAALKSAVERNPQSAIAWNELGVTLRMRGKFQDAAAAYERAIAADETFAPAHRNFAVLLDLYLGDPERALTELERYKELTGEERPVTGWIAELRQRTGKPTVPRPAAPAEPAPAEPAPADTAPPAAAPADAQSAPRIGAAPAADHRTQESRHA